MIKAGLHKLEREQYLYSYEKMLLLRRFEEKCGQLYGMGQIGGFCHLYIGQEAVIMGADLVRKKGDSWITSYRDHAHIILSGTDPKEVLAELTGKSTGCSKGKGGSMHMFSLEGKFYGGHGIVGAQVPIGTGLAFAEKYNGTDNISVVFMGDGAINQGQVYEAFNMASLWVLPVLYIIENNAYSMGTSVQRSTSMTDLSKKGLSFDIEGTSVDGMDLQAVYNTMKQASDYVRISSKPFIIEMKTYRFRGHSMSDPAKYRSKEEVDSFKANDPLAIVKDHILSNKMASEDEIKAINTKIKDIITQAESFALESELPNEDELYTEIFSR